MQTLFPPSTEWISEICSILTLNESVSEWILLYKLLSLTIIAQNTPLGSHCTLIGFNWHITNKHFIDQVLKQLFKTLSIGYSDHNLNLDIIWSPNDTIYWKGNQYTYREELCVNRYEALCNFEVKQGLSLKCIQQRYTQVYSRSIQKYTKYTGATITVWQYDNRTSGPHKCICDVHNVVNTDHFHLIHACVYFDTHNFKSSDTWYQQVFNLLRSWWESHTNLSWCLLIVKKEVQKGHFVQSPISQKVSPWRKVNERCQMTINN